VGGLVMGHGCSHVCLKKVALSSCLPCCAVLCCRPEDKKEKATRLKAEAAAREAGKVGRTAAAAAAMTKSNSNSSNDLQQQAQQQQQ